jgi:hypothetical protein
MTGMARRLDEFGPVEDARLTAMSQYLGLLDGWSPAALKTPVLLVRPNEPVDGSAVPGGDNRSSWPQDHEATEVTGDHFSMIGEYAPDTARAMAGWLVTLETREPV